MECSMLNVLQKMQNVMNLCGHKDILYTELNGMILDLTTVYKWLVKNYGYF